MKLAVLNDTHAGVRNDSDIFADYQDKFYEEVFFPYLEKHGIKRILHLGDFYDNRRSISMKTVNRTRKSFLQVLRARGIHMDIIPGNHDTFYKNTNELNSLKELLGHYMSEVTIHMDPTILNLDGLRIALIPWVARDNYVRCTEFIKEADAQWLAGHLELQGFDVLKGVPSHVGMDHKIFKQYDQVISGHFHTKSQKDNILYLGSQFEFTWNDVNDPKAFHIIDTVEQSITPVRNPYTLFHKILYDDTKHSYEDYDFTQCDNQFVKVVIINKKDLFTFDKFIDRIQERPIHDLKIAENFQEFLGENVADEDVSIEDTSTLMNTYVDAANTDLDKNRIKNMMQDLYKEAQVFEVA